MKQFTITFLFGLFLVPNCNAQGDWKTIGTNFMIQGEMEKALEAYQNHLEFYPNDIETYLNRSKIHGVMGNKNLARKDLNTALALNPYSKLYLDEAKRASKLMDKKYMYLPDSGTGFSKSPLKRKYYYQLVSNSKIDERSNSKIYEILEHLHLEEFILAEDKINDLNLSDSQSAILHDLEGLLLLKLGKYRRALNFFSKAISLDPSFSMSYHNRAICYSQLGETEAAMRDVEKAINQNSSISLFYFTLANLLEAQGEKEDALEAYSNALHEDENYLEALTNSANLLKELGDFEESRNILNEAISLDPQKIENVFQRGNLHFIYGEYEEAIDDYDFYLRMTTKMDDAAYFNRGLSKLLVGDMHSGCIDLSTSIEIEDDENKMNLYYHMCESPQIIQSRIKSSFLD